MIDLQRYSSYNFDTDLDAAIEGGKVRIVDLFSRRMRRFLAWFRWTVGPNSGPFCGALIFMSIFVAALVQHHAFMILLPSAFVLAMMVVQGCTVVHPKLKAYLRSRKKEIATLRKDLEAFHQQVGRLPLLKERTGLYGELESACYQKLLALEEQANEITRGIHRFRREHCPDPKERDEREAAEEKLQNERRELLILRDNLGKLVPEASVDRFTKDLAPHVATLQAIETLDRQATEAASAVAEADRK